MKTGRKILLMMLVIIIGAAPSVTVSASEAAQEELTPEEQAEIAEQQRVYALPVQTNELPGWPQGPGTYGEAAIVMEAETGAILYAKNIDDHHYPASITKVLTALVALENGQLSDPVVFSHDCVSFMKPGDSSVGLKEGNIITLEQALYATLLASANEAAYAVGENVGKNAGHDYSWFIGQMNAKCKSLGGENSNFVNTNGLHDPQHYTCARDMALIGSEIFTKHPEFFTIVQTMEYKIPASPTTEEHIFQQKHKMLKANNENYYPYAVGGKTGFTSDALSTLITMADNGQMKLVCVVLRTHGKNVYPDTRNLFEYAFQNFTKVDVASQEMPEEVESILPEGNTGCVVIPAGLDFGQLSMEIVQDEGISNEGTLVYSYEGQKVGQARARLSASYLEAHSAKVEKAEEKKTEPEKASEEKNGTGQSETKRSKMETIVLLAAVILLIVLIITLIIIIIRRHMKQKRRRQRREKREKTLDE